LTSHETPVLIQAGSVEAVEFGAVERTEKRSGCHWWVLLSCLDLEKSVVGKFKRAASGERIRALEVSGDVEENLIVRLGDEIVRGKVVGSVSDADVDHTKSVQSVAVQTSQDLLLCLSSVGDEFLRIIPNVVVDVQELSLEGDV
jgi:sporulation protein YlmC with PRC-barrel domain